MRNVPPSPAANRFLRQGLLGLAFLGLVSMLSLPAARGAGPVGWMPLTYSRPSVWPGPGRWT